MDKNIKKIYLVFRSVIFTVFSIFTFFLRRKVFHKESTRNILIIALERGGDTILSIPTFRAIKENLPKSKVTVFANYYVKDILERINYIDNLVIYDKGSSLFEKINIIRKSSHNRFDLAVDLTCDYTFETALLTFLSGAKYRVGYNTYGRGFLFNKPVNHETEHVHVIDEVLNIVKSISVNTQNKSLRIRASEGAEEKIRQFLIGENVQDEDLLIGIHPGGYYPTQRWQEKKFAEVSNKIIEKYDAKIILIGGPGEEKIVENIKSRTKNTPIVFLNHPLKDLIALLQRCHLLICDNSGPLHIATAVETPTVSMMGPTIPQRWWPHGEGHIVIRKNLPCMPCNEGYCRLKTNECMKSITVQEVFEAVESQLAKILQS